MAQLKEIQNPELIQAYHMLQYESTPERQGEFMQQVVNARFLAPAFFDPEPKKDENGRFVLDKNVKIGFPDLVNKDGKKYFPVFTDWKEAQKWDLKNGQRLAVTRFADYESLVLNNDQAAGFVINPFGENIRIERKTIEELSKQHKSYQGMRRYQRAGQGPMPQSPLEIAPLERYPQALADQVCDLLKDQPVKAAYIQGAIQDGVKGVVFVLDQEEGSQDLSGRIARLARPYMKGMFLFVTGAGSELGKKIMEGTEPFYRKK